MIPNKKQIRKEIYCLILPIILENVFQVSASLISIAMIGRLTAIDISSQGLCMRITETLNSLFRGIAIGATVYIARSYGEGNKHKCFNIFKQTILSTVPLSILCGAVLFATPLTFLSFLTKDPVILAKGQDYMRIVVCGLPFVSIMAIVTSTFQGHSNTRIPMYIAMLVNVVNMGLGYVLIFGIFGFEGLGINGAGLALVISQGVGALTGVCLLFSKKMNIFSIEQLKEKLFKYDFKCIKEVYSTGVPAAFESVFWQLSAIVMSKAIMTFGETSFAAYQIGIQAESITEMPAMGFGVAATALSAKAIGMRDDLLFKNYFKELVKSCFTISVVTSLLLILLPNVFMSAMTDKAEIQVIGAVYVFVMGFVQIPQNLSRIYNGTIRAAGFKNAPMLISGTGIWLIRIPLALLVTYVFKLDIIFIWLCIVVDQFTRFALSIILFKRKKINDTVLNMN